MTKDILLVGLGGIGFRHFQALTNISIKANIYLVDINEESLKNASEYMKSVNNPNVLEVKYFHDVNQINGRINLAIIATSSLVRRKIIEDLLERTEVEYLVLEKILFPYIRDYDEVNTLLNKKNVTTFVNCPDRVYPGYIDLKNRLKEVNSIHAIVTGNNWGISCNAIHIIDMLDYIINANGEKVFCSGTSLDQEIIESKRKGYIEFSGSFVGCLGERVKFVLESSKAKESSGWMIYIYAGDLLYIINESKREMKIYDMLKGIIKEETDFQIYYQSQLTNKIAEELFEKGICLLTPFQRSCELHIPMIEAFLNQINHEKEEKTELCSIT